jgi:ubiquinone/menaquinone biosynthesis C-methylase UbiE
MTADQSQPVENENTYVINSENVAEMVRLRIQDMMVTKAMGGLFIEPVTITPSSRILDVACGPGGWALEVAYTYPEAEVIGIDISERMITYTNTQARVQGLDNARFLTMNVLEPLQFADNSFDIVNARFLTFFMLKDAWMPLVREMVRITRSGGRIYLTETNDSGVTNSPAFQRWYELFAKAYAQAGRSFNPNGQHAGITPMLGKFLQDAGCQDIIEKMNVLNFSAGSPAHQSYYENYKVAFLLAQEFTIKMGIATREEMNALYEQTMLEMLQDNFRAHLYYLTVRGIKP